MGVVGLKEEEDVKSVRFGEKGICVQNTEGFLFLNTHINVRMKRGEESAIRRE